MRIEEINEFDRHRFVNTIGWVFENSPWVAERAWAQRPFASLDELSAAMNGEIETAARDEQLALLRAHPDLGTRARLSPGSAAEQAGIGLDALTQAGYEQLLRLNTAYRQKFGFPFIYAVKGSDRSAILEALRARLRSDREAEFLEALRQVYRIARFRLETILGDTQD
jgi:2-oxo-4-hydroxy-4-carboxy-5-ureidoimidazoline decarboxylase